MRGSTWLTSAESYAAREKRTAACLPTASSGKRNSPDFWKRSVASRNASDMRS